MCIVCSSRSKSVCESPGTYISSPRVSREKADGC